MQPTYDEKKLALRKVKTFLLISLKYAKDSVFYHRFIFTIFSIILFENYPFEICFNFRMSCQRFYLPSWFSLFLSSWMTSMNSLNDLVWCKLFNAILFLKTEWIILRGHFIGNCVLEYSNQLYYSLPLNFKIWLEDTFS